MLNAGIDDVQLASEIELRKKNMNILLNQPHDQKVKRSKATVREFTDILGKDTCYVSTSGGKDSAVLSHLTVDTVGEIKHIMFNTGLEYTDTINLAKRQGATIIPPTISWVKSCNNHGYPIVSKNVSRRLHDIGRTPILTAVSLFNGTYGIKNTWLHLTDKKFVDFEVSEYCCTEFKKKPSKLLKGNPIIGTRIVEGNNRKSAWKKTGCNSYSSDGKSGVSRPISLWKDMDVDTYVKDNDVELSCLYTQYEQKRTGCKICPYGAQLDGSRFDILKEREPRVYEYYMNNTLLKQILLVGDVDIVTDQEYMKQKQEIDKEIDEWRKVNQGSDNFLTYSCKLSLRYFSKEQMIDAVYHVYKDGKARLKFPLEEIVKKLKEL